MHRASTKQTNSDCVAAAASADGDCKHWSPDFAVKASLAAAPVETLTKAQGNGACLHPTALGQPTQPPRRPPHFHPVNNSLINRRAITTCQAKLMGKTRIQKGCATCAAVYSSEGSRIFLQSLLIRATASTSQLITTATNAGRV